MIRAALRRVLWSNTNESVRSAWLSATLARLPDGYRILDAGAGELANKPLCDHLRYVSQDFCQYQGKGDGQGFQRKVWDTSHVDLICDITDIPEDDASFDAILCSEVFEHIPSPVGALEEFARLLKPGGKLIVTAPFVSWVHFAPYHFCSGFSRYWYEYHLPRYGFSIDELTPNGDWFQFCRYELTCLGYLARRYGDWSWPLAYITAVLAMPYFAIRGGRTSEDLACFGWHCVATRQ